MPLNGSAPKGFSFFTRLAVVVGAGLYWAAFPPVGFWPGIFASLAIFFALGGRSFLGWWALGALLQGGLIPWLITVTFWGWLGLSLVLGLFWGLPFYFWGRTRNALGVAALWVSLEGLRAWLGFGWLPVAAAVGEARAFLNWAQLGGEALVSFLLVFLAARLAAFLVKPSGKAAAGVLALFFVVSVLGWQMRRGNVFFEASKEEPQLEVLAALIQPATEMPIVTDAEFIKSLERLSALSARVMAKKPELYFWPEQSTPWPLNDDRQMRRWSEEGADYLGAPLVTGALWREGNEYFNAVATLQPGQGLLETHYAKRRLVPFGEFIPLGGLPFVHSLTRDVESFSAGESGAVLEVVLDKAVGRTLKIWPLICYEDAFDYLSWGARQADVIAVFSNDAWFGWEHSLWPFASAYAAQSQHAAHSVLRAVEQGLPVVRISNSGLSGRVSPRGQAVYLHAPESPSGALAGVLRVPLERNRTLYAALPQLWRAAGLCVLLGTLLWERRKESVSHKRADSEKIKS